MWIEERFVLCISGPYLEFPLINKVYYDDPPRCDRVISNAKGAYVATISHQATQEQVQPKPTRRQDPQQKPVKPAKRADDKEAALISGSEWSEAHSRRTRSSRQKAFVIKGKRQRGRRTPKRAFR
ncbi:hypothetical protein PRZ48_008871 [Zasmidium cellare]|uniref:Uncharacterized protein n=1 Tax=Zasmidium cellare TaxID=395010 RepID=A0ABR0EGU2_ZASCE|nr:hypothetical protein PRZ48_008871 [Zasmidium cellare]